MGQDGSLSGSCRGEETKASLGNTYHKETGIPDNWLDLGNEGNLMVLGRMRRRCHLFDQKESADWIGRLWRAVLAREESLQKEKGFVSFGYLEPSGTTNMNLNVALHMTYIHICITNFKIKK